MKIVIINGQNHKGTTEHIARMLAEKVGGEIKEFFLPRDFGEFCVGCTNCFIKSEEKCPHYNGLKNITDAMLEADLIILASPVYVFHTTGAMKSFLDHYGYMWMVHRPKEEMFKKQAVCISTAAGMGMKSTNKDMSHSLFFWGVPIRYKIGLAVFETRYSNISDKVKLRIDKKTTAIANKIKKRENKVKVTISTRAFFFGMHLLQRKGFNETDRNYWKNKGWTGSKRPWNMVL